MKDEQEERPVDLKTRTKQLALRVIRLYSALPKNNDVAQVLGRQLLKAGTSAGAHYREGTRARSDAEFIRKLEGGLQELDESAYWLELLADSETVPGPKLNDLRAEVDELIAVITTCVKNAKRRKDQ